MTLIVGVMLYDSWWMVLVYLRAVASKIIENFTKKAQPHRLLIKISASLTHSAARRQDNQIIYHYFILSFSPSLPLPLSLYPSPSLSLSLSLQPRAGAHPLFSPTLPLLKVSYIAQKNAVD